MEKKHKQRIVKHPQDVPRGYVLLSEFGSQNYPWLARFVYNGKLKSVKLLFDSKGNRGAIYVDKKQVVEALEANGISAPSVSSLVQKDQRVDDRLYMIIDLMKRLEDKIDNVVSESGNSWSLEKEYFDSYEKTLGRFVETVVNVERHIVILGSLVFGLIEQLGAGKECFDRSKVRERLLLLNRLITREEWEAGFPEEKE